MPITITGQGTLNNDSGNAKYGTTNLNAIKFGSTTVWTAQSTKKYNFTTKDTGGNVGSGNTTTNAVTIDADFQSANKLVIAWTAKQTGSSSSGYVINDSGNYEIQIGINGTYTTIASSPLSGWSTGYSVNGATASGSKTLTGTYNPTSVTLRFKKNISQGLQFSIGGSITITRNF